MFFFACFDSKKIVSHFFKTLEIRRLARSIATFHLVTSSLITMYTKLWRNTKRIFSKFDAISLPHKRRKIPTEICLGCSLLNPFLDEWSKWMSRCFVISFPQPHGFAQKCVESRAREKPKESVVVDYNVSFPLTTLNYTHTHTHMKCGAMTYHMVILINGCNSMK